MLKAILYVPPALVCSNKTPIQILYKQKSKKTVSFDISSNQIHHYASNELSSTNG